jgi:hypothetical protein
MHSAQGCRGGASVTGVHMRGAHTYMSKLTQPSRQITQSACCRGRERDRDETGCNLFFPAVAPCTALLCLKLLLGCAWTRAFMYAERQSQLHLRSSAGYDFACRLSRVFLCLPLIQASLADPDVIEGVSTVPGCKTG